MAWVRCVLAATSAVFLFVGGSNMRDLTSELDPALGLLAYGAGFAVLAYGVAGLTGVGRSEPQQQRPQPSRSWYEDA